MAGTLRRMDCWAAVLGGALTLVGVAALAAPSPTPEYEVTAHIPGPDGFWDYASFEPLKRRVYVARGDGLMALGVDSGKLTPHLADGQRTHEPLPLPGGHRLLLTNGAANNARLVDTDTGAIIADIPTAPGPDAAVFDPATRLALVIGHAGAVTLIDPRAAKVVGTIDVGGTLEFAAADGEGRAYVNIESKDEIAVIDTRRRKVIGHYVMKGCESPSGLAYAARLGLLIAACANNVAAVVRASDGAPVTDLAIGKGPDAVILDERRRLAFIPCGWDGELDVIALKSAKDIAVVQTVKTQPGARTGTVDPKTGKLYLPSATYTLTGGRPTVTPGTFQILVVSPR
jgi:hypothetical protein